ncbi:MAG: ABC transporter permease [Aestuariibacter sp.]
MYKNYLVIAWRNLLKNGTFSVINIFGLALGLMSCILIMLFVRDESGYEQWIPDHNRIVRMHTGYEIPGRPPFLTVRSAGSMMPAVRDYAQNEVEAAVRFVRFGISILRDGDAFAENVNMVDPDFFKVFDLPFVHGSADTSFQKPFDLVISEETALRHFGRTDVVGEVLTMCCNQGQQISLPVAGVVKDTPEQTHLDLDMIVYMQPAIFNEPGTLETFNSVNVYTYFKMRPGVTVEQFQTRLRYWVNNESPFVEMAANFGGEMPEGTLISDVVQHKLMPIADIHLQAKNHAGSMGDFKALGDGRMVVTFTIIAGLILLIAAINFMNLSTARASQRAREVAMRKVLGASKRQIGLQFLGEAMFIVTVSMVLAIAMVELVLPFYNDALGKSLQVDLLQDATLLGFILGTILIVGGGAGTYPALIMSRFLPINMLHGSKGAESGQSSALRTGLVIFQFAMSIALVICTVVVYGQTKYAQNMDVGFNSADKLVLNLNGTGDNAEGLRQSLLQLPEIKSVVYSSEAPTQDNENNTNFKLLDSDGSNTTVVQELFNYHNMDFGFFEDYQIAPLAGRLFSRDFGSDMMQAVENSDNQMGQASIILNESAVRKLGFTQPQDAIGKALEADVYRMGMFRFEIIGVIPDVFFRSIKFEIRPTVYMMNPTRFRVANLTYESDNPGELLAKIEQVWKQHVTTTPINLQFLKEMLDAQYQDELVQAELFFVFSLLAIVVACMGLYGLASYTTERRTREIGIRKVMGATVTDIVKLLIWQFSKPVLFANIVAWPLSTYFMIGWLQGFPYRIEYMWLLPVSLAVGGILLFMAWATVGGNAARVAKTRPAFVLRQE